MAKVNYAKLYTLKPDGRYQGYWRDQDGKRHALCDRDPERLYHRLEEKQTPPSLTFAVIADRWYDDSQSIYKPGTWAGYDASYRRAIDLFGDMPAVELNSAHIAAHLDQMSLQGYGERSLKAQRTVYSLIYKHAAQLPEYAPMIRYNPAAMAALPAKRIKPKKKKAPEDEAIARIILGLESYFGLYPYLLLCTGLRRGEALGLRWMDVDLQRDVIAVSQGVTYRSGLTCIGDTKTEESQRSVPILPMLHVVLLAAQEDPEVYLFHGENPKAPLSEATYRRRWAHWCRENGFAVVIEDGKTPVRNQPHYRYRYTLTAHVLRHGYASISQWGGVDKDRIRALLGHTNIRTTEIYLHELEGPRAPELALAAAAIQREVQEILAASSVR